MGLAVRLGGRRQAGEGNFIYRGARAAPAAVRASDRDRASRLASKNARLHSPSRKAAGGNTSSEKEKPL